MTFKRLLPAAFGAALLPMAASAHATLAQAQAEIGATSKFTLRVPHGCDGQATHTVRLKIPEGVYNVKPMPKAGWDLATETGAYATPYMNHGTEMTEGVRTVTWSGGHLEDGWYDEFTVRGAVGPDVAPDSTLYFPAVQTCADGTVDWTDTSGAQGLPNPAPKLIAIAGEGGHGHHGGHDHAMAEGPVTLGDIEIAAPFARATLPNQPVGGGFMTLTNSGAEADTLMAARSPAAGRVEIHEMAMQGDVMKMRALADGLPLPAGETVALEPGGYHIMFMDLAGPLAEGDSVEVTLTFEQAGDVTLTMPVRARDAGAMAHDHSSH